MTTDLSQLNLCRVPPAPELQAYNAADELTVQHCQHNEVAAGRWLLVNDAFGTLATALSADYLDWWNDSAMAREALDRNLQVNNGKTPRIITSTTDLDEHYAHVIIHAPKSLALFDWQLNEIRQRLINGGQCWVPGMVKHLSSGHQKVMKRYFANINPGLAVKKARCVSLSNPIPGSTLLSTSEYTVNGITLVNHPGSFSESHTDPGALAFLGVFNMLPAAERFVDLGCGNGILALSYLKQTPNALAILVDESRQATASAAASAERNGLRAQIHHANGLSSLGLTDLPLILCNPPFHQSTTLTTDIAHSLFEQAAEALAVDGEFWVVGNRHLNYHKSLRLWFAAVETVSRHPKFVVFRCRQAKRQRR